MKRRRKTTFPSGPSGVVLAFVEKPYVATRSPYTLYNMVAQTSPTSVGVRVFVLRDFIKSRTVNCPIVQWDLCTWISQVTLSIPPRMLISRNFLFDHIDLHWILILAHTIRVIRCQVLSKHIIRKSSVGSSDPPVHQERHNGSMDIKTEAYHAITSDKPTWGKP